MNEKSTSDIEACRSLLREIADLCEHASLTGSLSGGAARVVRRYNAVLSEMLQAGTVPPNMFEPLPESADYGEVGVEARMLSSFLKKGIKEKTRGMEGDPSVLVRLAPFVRQEDLAALIRQHTEGGMRFDMDLAVQLAPFLSQEALSEILQEHLRGHREPPPPPEPPAPPAPPASSEPSRSMVSYGELHPTRAPGNEEKLLVLIERLKDPRLTSEERADLLDRIRALPG